MLDGVLWVPAPTGTPPHPLAGAARGAWNRNMPAASALHLQPPADAPSASLSSSLLPFRYSFPTRYVRPRAALPSIHTFAEALVAPLKAALDTREPTTVCVALQLMLTCISLDQQVADLWVQHYWQFAQVGFPAGRSGSQRETVRLQCLRHDRGLQCEESREGEE